jgi:AcrR family transcriptional regulator
MAITREPLTRLRIVELALNIIDTEGLPALNMRRLAAAAGVKPMSLYHHFANKEAILAEVAENIAAAALGDQRAAGPWRERARLLFVGLYELVQAHPRALPLITTGVLRTPSGRRWMEELMGVLLEAGFTTDAAARVYHLLGAFTLGLGYAQLLSLEVPPETHVGALRAVVVGVAVGPARRGDIGLDNDEIGLVVEAQLLHVLVLQVDLVVRVEVAGQGGETERREQRVLDGAPVDAVGGRLGRRDHLHLERPPTRGPAAHQTSPSSSLSKRSSSTSRPVAKSAGWSQIASCSPTRRRFG